MQIIIFLISIFYKYKLNLKYSISCGIKTRIIGKNIYLGKNVSILGRLTSSSRGRIQIGDNTTIRFNTIIESETEVIISKNVIISNNVIITDNDSHPTSPLKREKMSLAGTNTDLWDWKHSRSAPIFIGENVWIGRGSLISKGVNIGKGSIVASNAVVTKNVPPYSLVYGNPCIIKSGKYEKG